MKTQAAEDFGYAAPAIVAATHHTADIQPADVLPRAVTFAQPLLASRVLDTGEPAWDHAQGVQSILHDLGASEEMRACVFLVYAADFLQQPQETITRAFGHSEAQLVQLTRKLVQIQRAARDAGAGGFERSRQIDRVRKMLLAFSQDLRVVLLRLASRLQTLRWYAASKVSCPHELAQESLDVFGPLAHRLGIGQVKWELEDLSFRFLNPQAYHGLAQRLDATRLQRERSVDQSVRRLMALLAEHQLDVQVYGRPKHLYSIWKKMQVKHLPLERIFDVRALRVMAPTPAACYDVLSIVHQRYRPVAGEFDDYILRPKANGYRSLHTVVLDDDDQAMEVQIRTPEMHEQAEYGVAAHWAYKESAGQAQRTAEPVADDGQAARARLAVVRQLLAWEQDLSASPADAAPSADTQDSRLYVLTPQATVVELPAGATPVDFAYHLHTELGHRCRGARVDGQMVPLTYALSNAQTVEIITGREGGPSMDWLNPELGYLMSPRARAKVRAYFNTQAQAQTAAKGRELIEKLLQREGKTATSLDDLAQRLGLGSAQRLFDLVGKDEMSLRQVESVLHPAPTPPEADSGFPAVSRSKAGASGVLVVGVDSLMNQLARCCRPAPPDAIGGYVTRGKGVAVHRSSCVNFRQLTQRSPQRVIPVSWGPGPAQNGAVYPIDIGVEAHDRPGLLRDLSEVLARERVNVTAVKSQTAQVAGQARARMTFTVEMPNARGLPLLLQHLAHIPGVVLARRR